MCDSQSEKLTGEDFDEAGLEELELPADELPQAASTAAESATAESAAKGFLLAGTCRGDPRYPVGKDLLLSSVVLILIRLLSFQD